MLFYLLNENGFVSIVLSEFSIGPYLIDTIRLE